MSATKTSDQAPGLHPEGVLETRSGKSFKYRFNWFALHVLEREVGQSVGVVIVRLEAGGFNVGLAAALLLAGLEGQRMFEGGTGEPWRQADVYRILEDVPDGLVLYRDMNNALGVALRDYFPSMISNVKEKGPESKKAKANRKKTATTGRAGSPQQPASE